MAWNVQGTDEFAEWYGDLTKDEQRSIEFAIEMLVEVGPTLGRPYADTVNGSSYANMKELRGRGNTLRAFFAFDPNRSAILLIGGDKSGDKTFYDRMIPQADSLYAVYLKEIEEEKTNGN